MENFGNYQPLMVDDLYLENAIPIVHSNKYIHYLKPSKIIDIFEAVLENNKS